MARSARVVWRPAGGKTVVVELGVGEDCRVASAVVSGDFFVYPEEALEVFEESLRGCGDRDCVLGAAARAAGVSEAVIGFTWEELGEVVAGLWSRLCGAAEEPL